MASRGGPSTRRLRQLAAELRAEGASAEGCDLVLTWETFATTSIVLGATFNSTDPDVPDPDYDLCLATLLEAFRWGMAVDTAPLYRDSEEIIGAAVAKSVAAGAHVDLLAQHVWTKVGLRTGAPLDGDEPWVEHGGATADAARRSLAASLERLALPDQYCIGGLRFHDIAGGDLPTTNDLIDRAVAPGGMVEALRSLREAGRIGEVSLGMNANGDRPGSAARPADTPGKCLDNTEPQQILRLIRKAPTGTFDSALVNGGFNLLNQDAYEVFVECQARGIKVHNAGIYAGGLLLGGAPTERMPYTVTPELQQRLDGWKALADKYGVPMQAIALRFASMPAVVSKLVVGLSNPAEVRTTIEALMVGRYIPQTLWTEAQSQGLLPKRIQLPPVVPEATDGEGRD